MTDQDNRTNEPNKIGVRALAAKTGLSVATISRVLNNHSGVKPETRRKVHQAINESGYIPNHAARSLATQRSKTIAAVVPTLAHSIFAEFLDALEKTLAQSHYSLAIATFQGDLAEEAKRAHAMLNIGIDGIILSGLKHDQALLERLTASKTATILSSIYESEHAFPCIGYDNAGLAEIAIQYLYQKGHRKIAILHGPTQQNDRTQRRIAGAFKAQATLDKLTLLAYETTLNCQGGSEAVNKAMCESPDAILCLSDVLALGVLFELHRKGISVPDDISVMGFDDLDWAQYASPALTTISLPVKLMGHRCAEQLIAKLEQQQPIQSIKLDAQIIQRNSVKCRH